MPRSPRCDAALFLSPLVPAKAGTQTFAKNGMPAFAGMSGVSVNFGGAIALFTTRNSVIAAATPLKRTRGAVSARCRSLFPHPSVSHDFYSRREDQRAKSRLRHRLHR